MPGAFAPLHPLHANIRGSHPPSPALALQVSIFGWVGHDISPGEFNPARLGIVCSDGSEWRQEKYNEGYGAKDFDFKTITCPLGLTAFNIWVKDWNTGLVAALQIFCGGVLRPVIGTPASTPPVVSTLSSFSCADG